LSKIAEDAYLCCYIFMCLLNETANQNDGPQLLYDDNPEISIKKEKSAKRVY